MKIRFNIGWWLEREYFELSEKELQLPAPRVAILHRTWIQIYKTYKDSFWHAQYIMDCQDFEFKTNCTTWYTTL